MNRKAEALLAQAADAVFNCVPRRKPSHAQLNRVRIVSHRGECHNAGTRENTISAFDAAHDAGVWGLECDVRYTADGEPVVIHDADLKRVFGDPAAVADTAWSRLHARAPEVPHLEGLLARYGGDAHLMLELKERAPGTGEARLLRLLGALAPGTDFHVLAMDPELFTAVRGLPGRCRLPVAKFNTRAMLDYALTHECAGLAGSYMLLGAAPLRKLQAAGLSIGTGYVSNQAVLWREAARGVDWLFSSNAARLQRLLDQARIT